VHNNFNIIDILLWERNARKNINNYLKITTKSLTSSDLSNFAYCPVGFSISKTFNLPTSKLTSNGSIFHNRNYLLNFSKSKRYKINKKDKINTDDVINVKSIDFFKDILSSNLLFIGHSQNSSDFFKNNLLNYTGQPDYIYDNQYGQVYVVEEKFKSIKYADNQLFFKNHKVQLASYMNLFERNDISYGYLVYWLYDDSDNIVGCRVNKILNNNIVHNFLSKEIKSISNFIQRGEIVLDRSSLYPKKCAHCVNVLLCGHKTKKLDIVTYPYNKNHLKLYKSTFQDDF
jgi:CRISPR/Cas system-associated exonuclease Cas4 (RecB family)